MAKIKMTAVVTGQEQLTEDIFDMKMCIRDRPYGAP